MNYFQCYDVPLTTNGVTEITLHATDLAGNTCTTNISLTLDYSSDTNPPVISVDWPTNGAIIAGTNFVLQGSVSDPTATVTISIVDANGNTTMVTANVTRSGQILAENIPLGAGPNTMTVTATSAGGYANITNLTVVQTGSDLSMDFAEASFGVNVSMNNALPGQQTSFQSGPVSIVLKSRRTHFESSSLGYWQGPYGENPPGCYPWANYLDKTEWDYLGGGADYGYYSDSGYWNPYIEFDNWPEDYQPWYTVLPPGVAPCDQGLNVYAGDEYEYDRLLMVSPSGQGSVDTVATYVVQAQLWQTAGFDPTTNQILSDCISISNMPAVQVTYPDGSIWDTVIMTVPAGVNVDVTPTAPGNYSFNVQAYQLGQLLAVDNNRDGQITFDNTDATTQINPYRFWANDSQEGGDISSAADDIPGSSSPNYNGDHANGRSDLVNFFPVALCLSNVLQWLPPTNGFEYHLSQADGAVKFIYTALERANAFDYLTNLDGYDYGTYFNERAITAYATTVTLEGNTLNTTFLDLIQADGNKGVILVEGIKATQQPLMLEIWHRDQYGNKQLMGGVPLYLSIDGVEKMYRHKNLRDGADAPIGLAGDLTARDNDASLPTQPNEPENYPDSLSNGRWFVFVVGSNVGGQNSRGWESEVFKRMYWSGNKAKFVGVSWFGDPYTNSEGIFDYHMAVQNAFATAPWLASFVNNLSGNKTIAGHSLGCGLIASAIADSGMNVNNACLMDAAFAQECLDGDADDNLTAMRPTAWQDYPTNLWAAHWHELFTDARSYLTWRDRFAGAIGKVYNFYSSTEDALGEYDGEVPGNSGLSIVNSVEALIVSGTDFQNYVWVYQEKAKGNRQYYYVPLPNLDLSIAAAPMAAGASISKIH